MIQTEDQRLRSVRKHVTRDWLTCANLHLCKEQQSVTLLDILCSSYKPALDLLLLIKTREPDQLGNPAARNNGVQQSARCGRHKIMMWEAGSMQRDSEKKGRNICIAHWIWYREEIWSAWVMWLGGRQIAVNCSQKHEAWHSLFNLCLSQA